MKQVKYQTRKSTTTRKSDAERKRIGLPKGLPFFILLVERYTKKPHAIIFDMWIVIFNTFDLNFPFIIQKFKSS